MENKQNIFFYEEEMWDGEYVPVIDINEKINEIFDIGDVVEFQISKKEPICLGKIVKIDKENKNKKIKIVSLWNDTVKYVVDTNKMTIGIGNQELRFIKKIKINQIF